MQQAREVTGIPVIGAGEATAFVARITGRKIGAVGITDSPPGVIRELLGARLAAGELPVSRIPCLPQPQSDLGDASTQFRGTFQSKSIAVQLILETARHDIGPRV